LYDLKFDPKYFIPVSIKKPLGLSLVEVEVDKKSGVFVDDMDSDGSAKASGVIKKGLYLMEINGVDVKYQDFDTILDLLIDAPADKPLDLLFVDPNLVMKGSATLTVTTIEGKVVKLNALKGQILRTVLQDNKLQVYKGKGVIVLGYSGL
jgi:C-terminal processing protease CtpA/Prc